MGLISDQSRDRIPELTTGDQVPLHPALTDVPVATISLAPVFDGIALLTGSQTAGAAGLWVGATGVLWSIPTAATGTLDYLRAGSGSPVKRVGLAHAALNTFALTMMTASLISRRFRSAPTPLSLLFSAAAGAAVTYSSHLGGVLVYREGMRVSGQGLQAAGETEPQMIAAEPARLGSGGSEASTLGGVREDSPETHDAGLVTAPTSDAGLEGPAGPLDVEPPSRSVTGDLLVQTSGEQWDELDRLESAVEEGKDSPDDFALGQGGAEGAGEERGEETGGTSRAA